jgi:hypothetical protein
MDAQQYPCPMPHVHAKLTVLQPPYRMYLDHLATTSTLGPVSSEKMAIKNVFLDESAFGIPLWIDMKEEPP